MMPHQNGLRAVHCTPRIGSVTCAGRRGLHVLLLLYACQWLSYSSTVLGDAGAPAPAPAPAQHPSTLALLSILYIRQETYLLKWLRVSFLNFPSTLWAGASANAELQDDLVLGTFRACPGSNYPSPQGLSCTADGNISAIDLSFSSLPPGMERLRGSLFNNISAPPIVSLPFLNTLNLAGNLMTNKLPVGLSYAPSLTRLILNGNQFNGTIPSEICSMQLTCLNLADNSFSGQIPKCLSRVPCVDFEGNKFERRPGDCDKGSAVSSCAPRSLISIAAPPPPPLQQASSLSVGATVGLVAAALVFLAAALAVAVLYKRWHQRKLEDERRRLLSSDVEAVISSRHFGGLMRFTEEELRSACDDFNPDAILGEGGYSTVFKGRLADGRDVAIKRIKAQKMGAGCELEFLNEVEVISRAVHRNLVRSLGYCVEPGVCLMLVLQYYPNGSVASRTYCKQGDPLTWEQRAMIAKGAAEGIAYLHHDCTPKLIHRDIKPENVLLSESHEAAIADFGLAAELRTDDQERNTQVKGTLGHIAPEYMLSGLCSEKADVYAFGVVLLELVSGRAVGDLSQLIEAEDALLPDWVRSCMQHDDGQKLLLDPELGSFEDVRANKQVLQVLDLAVDCMAPDPAARPGMNDVARRLDFGRELTTLSKGMPTDSLPKEKSSGMDDLLMDMMAAVENKDYIVGDIDSTIVDGSQSEQSTFLGSQVGNSEKNFSSGPYM